MLRAIVHLDADAFFASVEQAADPRLRGKPVAVGGEKRGIIASASYEARKMGVYTPMPTSRARKLCPKLIVLPGDFDKYEHFSRWMFSYAYDFTPDVEVSSIDEGYLDLSGTRKAPVEIAQILRHAIRQSLKITISEGIATNKLVSQIASKLHKPAAFAEVPGDQEKPFLQPLPNTWLPGIGPQTALKLNAAGLARIGQVAATPLDLLHLLLGNGAARVKQYANGVDERPIVPVHDPAKSYSQQQTFLADTTDVEFLEATLKHMADRLMATVRGEGKSIRTVTVKVRYNDMVEDQVSESLEEPTDLENDLYARLPEFLRRAWKRRVSVRMVSLKLSNVYDGFCRIELALERSARQDAARRRLATTLDQLRQEHGFGVILRGHDFLLASKASDSGTAAPESAGKDPSADAATPELHDAFSPARAGWRMNAPSSSGSSGLTSRFTYSRLGAGDAARVRHRAAVRAATYVPLNVHSYYSFLDSTLSIENIVQLAREYGLPAVALTDTGNLHGAVAFSVAARQAGIKPILGAAVCVEGQPLRLLVQDQTGYHHLCCLLSELGAPDSGAEEENEASERRPGSSASQADTKSGAGRPMAVPVAERARLRTVTQGQLERFNEGLLAISPCPPLDRWFPGRFYYEPPAPPARPAAASELPWVASLPVHYHRREDRWKYDVVQSIRTRTLLRQEHPAKRLEGDFHFPAPTEMAARFKDHPEAIANTLALAERCNFTLPLGRPQFPAFVPPDGSSPRAYLRRLAEAGLRERYPQRFSQVQAQVEEELAIISAVGYEEYFLVVWDLLQACRQQGIEWITRGSAADSLVCYCLRISDVCPLRFDLYFRRFLNQDRMRLNKLPDIDVDFPHDRKDDVIDLIFEKYGAQHAAVVGGFSTFQARSAVADVAKVLGVSEYQIRRFTEHFPYGSAQDIQNRVAASQECRDLPMTDEPYRTAFEMAEFLDGFPRYPKMHPCGVVLSRQPMAELTPTFVSQKNYPTTHYDMDAVEAIGLVKIDILAQGGLAAMRDVREDLTKRGVEIDLGGLEPWTDPAVWQMIAEGQARAVHHIESPAMIGLCRQSNVHEIDGLIAIVSVIRPGAANENKKLKFTRRYQGFEPVEYPDPSLEACLRSTFGLVVYEEHILQICEAFAGLAPGRADVLRRALGKNKQAIIDEIKPEFVAAARARGHAEAKIAEVWELVTGFAGYAFCKAHSTAYGVEAYQSAWLKRYYPAEFMAAVLSNGKGFYQPLVYVLECHRLGLSLLPPAINEPGPRFQVVAQKDEASAGSARPAIRVPVTALKGLSERTLDRLFAERQRGEFGSLANFYARVQPAGEEMEVLIRAGALDGFGKPRTAQFWEFQMLARAFGSSSEPGQGWLLPWPGAERLPEVPLQEPTRRQRLEWEAELLGYPASGHPLELHADIAWDTYCPVARLGDHVGTRVMTCGLVIEQRLHHQVTGEPMKFLTLADWTGIVETELFAPTYRSYGLATVRYPVLEVTATVEPFENERGFSLRVHRAGKPRLITGSVG